MVRKQAAILAVVLVIGILLGVMGLFLVLRTAERSRVDSALGNARPATSVGSEGSAGALIDLALETAACLRDEDFAALSNIVHPTLGVYFSPNATVNLKNNRWFSAQEVADFRKDKASYVWGVDETNVPIELGVTEYFDAYINDYDYLAAQLVGVNTIARQAGALENVTEAFPNAQFVDLCYTGTEENEYHDWSILRLVFETCSDGTYRLTAVIHSAYTA